MAKSHRGGGALQNTDEHRRWFLRTACVVSALTVFAGQGGAGEKVVPPADATVMTAGELHALYNDQTWVWSDGAGRMQSDGRRFVAWAGSGASATWAEGRWTITSSGRLCFKARWHSSSGSHPAKTCFAHKRRRGEIYQRKEPTGDWYIFKHAVSEEGDEFKKLTDKDLVSPVLETVRSQLREKSPATSQPATE
ncbi:DUF995 domain-containing protein [Allomesorhizobium alhagi]|uniref:DUF995 domain-containing protein n=1 Tax=Mesorhizobium alhagi CCNWXJ12-2 TaxID=1107882 RepID=H0HYH7_9HYPH|nr:DUF995 domain-containing protein [Mesorhizobium alhagi]EHK54235.1 hypothetical protein MAXJ12_26288 [Mesorhizobium alhagi CCNWXJ12-2]